MLWRTQWSVKVFFRATRSCHNTKISKDTKWLSWWKARIEYIRFMPQIIFRYRFGVEIENKLIIIIEI